MRSLAVLALLAVAACAWWLAGERGVPVAGPGDPAVAGGVRAPAANEGAARSAAADPVPNADGPGAAPRRELTLELTVRVVDGDDLPLAGVEVRGWREQGSEMLVATDAAGRAQLPAGGGAGVLRIAAPARPARWVRVPAGADELRVVLDRGAVVAGRMFVDGIDARAGLVLTLHGGGDEAPDELPEAAQRWVAAHADDPVGRAVVAKGGTFAFGGLAVDWHGSLELPPGHHLLDGPVEDAARRFLSLPAPHQGLVVATTCVPTVRGRVVWDDTGEGVDAPDLTCAATFADGTEMESVSVTGDASGRFAIGLAGVPGEDSGTGADEAMAAASGGPPAWIDPARRASVASVELTVTADGCADAVELQLDAERVAADTELTVRLVRALPLFFRAIDAAGLPVAGARTQEPFTSEISAPTDAEGLGTFTGRRRLMLIGAPGYAIADVDPQGGVGTRDDPIVFVLARCSALVLRVRTPDGSVPPIRCAVVEAERALFTGRTHPVNLDWELGGAVCYASAKVENLKEGAERLLALEMKVVLDDKGEARLLSLEPGVACTVTVRGEPGGAVLASKSLVTPAAGEQRTVDLVVTAAQRRLHGRVVAADGTPIQYAIVSAIVGAAAGWPAVTDPDGAFELHLAADEAVRLQVRSPGFAMASRDGLTSDRDHLAIEFRLQPGRSVHAAVRDAADAVVPVPIHYIADGEPAALPGIEMLRHVVGEGQFADLPAGAVTFWCEVGGRRFEMRHDTAVVDAVLRVPTPARVVVAPALGWPPPPPGSALVVLVRRVGEAEVATVLPAGDPTATHLLLPGRYRLELAEQSAAGAATPLGPAADVDLRAGVTTDVALR